MAQLQRGEHPWRENPIAQLKRDLQKAKSVLPLLTSLQLVANPTLSLQADEAFDLFTTYGDTLKNIGFHLVVPKWMTRKRKPKVTLSIGHPTEHQTAAEPLLDWQSVASFTYEIAIGDKVISKEEFEHAVKEHRPFLYANGEWIAWDPALAQQL